MDAVETHRKPSLQTIADLVGEAWPAIFNRVAQIQVTEVERPETEWSGPATVQAICVDGIFVYQTEMDAPSLTGHNTSHAWGLGITNLIPLQPGADFEYYDEFEELTRVLRQTSEGDAELVRELAGRVARAAW
jgi:hypothetical protein